MKRRNDKFFKEKEYIKLKEKYFSDLTNNRNNYIVLDEPLHKGWKFIFKLRADISRREDAWVYQYIIDKFGISSYVFKNKKDCNNLTSKVRYIKHSYYGNDYANPHIVDIGEKQYEDLPIAVKKCFSYLKDTIFAGKLYTCNIPNFYVEKVLVKHFITKIPILDSELESEISFVRSKLDTDFHNEWAAYSPKKWVRKYLNGVRRTRTKQQLKTYVDPEDLTFDDNYKDARWF